jgi:molecular chaperone GrpE
MSKDKNRPDPFAAGRDESHAEQDTPAAGGREGAEAAPGTGATPNDELAQIAQERDKLHAQLQRTLADLQNFRKRRAQEMAEARQSGIESVASELLPVLDSFHLATDYDPEAGENPTGSMREGLLMVKGILEGVFQRHGIEEIPAQGERFDPAVHEAVGIDPRPEAEEGRVTVVMQRGYRFDNQRVIRPTRVMVGGAPAAGSAEGPAVQARDTDADGPADPGGRDAGEEG